MTLVALFTLASTTMYNSLEGVKSVVKTVDTRSHRRWGRPRHDYTDSHVCLPARRWPGTPRTMTNAGDRRSLGSVAEVHAFECASRFAAPHRSVAAQV